MRKKYKNDLYHLLTSTGLNINKFDFIIDESDVVTIKYKDTPFEFSIRNSPESYENFEYQYVSYSPGFGSTDWIPRTTYANFNEVQENLLYWINNDLKEFLVDEESPDLWTEFKKGNHNFNMNEIDFEDKSDFSNEDRIQTTMAINELKLLIEETFNTSDQQQKLVVDRLDYLIEASSRLNKFDWKGLALNTLVSISISLTLDTEKGRMLFILFQKVFSVVPILFQGGS